MSRDPRDIDTSTLRLLLAPGLGPVTLRRLREAFGSDEKIVAAGASDLQASGGLSRGAALQLRETIQSAEPDAERRIMRDRGVRLVLLGDAEYPPLLGAIADPPAALWVRGRLDPSDGLALAVVGSRRCSSYGREQAGRLSGHLAQCGLTIVSGGALGIDGEAHRAALRVSGRTIAVLGCGLARTYPRQHAELFEQIVTSGSAVMSEFPMNVEPRPGHFPRRNRVISGLSLGVVVVEAAARSGALITARLAVEEHGREGMALPGRVDSPLSRGTLQAIRAGWVALVRDHLDVLEQLDAARHLLRGAMEVAASGESDPTASAHAGALTPPQQAVVDVLGRDPGPMSLDGLMASTELTMPELLAALTVLEVAGRIHRDSAGVRRAASPTGFPDGPAAR